MKPKEYMVYNSSNDSIPKWYYTESAATAAMELEAKQDPGALVYVMRVVKVKQVNEFE